MKTRAFFGLTPDPAKVEEVATVPYDVVSTAEARELADGRPFDLLHVDRAEIDLPEGTNPYSDEVYETARNNFRKLVDDGVLVRDGQPCVYLYRQKMGDHVQTGIALACHVDDYGDDTIRKHEKTRPVKENDRTRLVGTLGAHTGPIFLTYKDVGVIDVLVARVADNDSPLFDFVDGTGVAHTVWRVEGGEEILQAFNNVSLAYVADGHHRTASAYRVGMERRAANPDHDGSEDYNWFLGVLFPASQLKILGYHRVVKDLAGRSPEEFLAAVDAVFERESVPGIREPESAGNIAMYVDGGWHRLKWPPLDVADPVRSLDVSVLQDRLLQPLLGIEDVRTDERIGFVGGVRGPGELEKRVDSGEWAVAFAMFPVNVDQLMAIADAGEIMPPKSTWFEPKIRSGLFIYSFD